MGNRLTKIITRTGDTGTTGLGDGTRVDKDHLRIEAIGEVDELNSSLGVLLAQRVPTNVEDVLKKIQHALFDLGGELCIPGTSLITATHIKQLETWAGEFNAELGPLRDFILPGGTPAAAHAHLARAVCRRVERRVVALAKEEGVSDDVRKYVNRLSDVLFILSRYLNHAAQQPDILWKRAPSESKE